MKLIKNEYYEKKERKFFNRHPDLLTRYATVLNKLKENPFDTSLRTHKLKVSLEAFYSCSLTYEYRLICSFIIQDDTIILVDIGSHDEVY